MARTLAQSARRYGPFVGVAVLVAAAVVVFGSGGDGNGEDGGAGTSQAEVAADGVDEEQLVRDGPLTPQQAELLGETDVDFGPNCDPATGRIRLPSLYSPQCVAAFDGDNGGATSPGVTGDEILLVYYQPAGSFNEVAISAIGESGPPLFDDTDQQTAQEYIELYQDLFETFGRTVRLESYRATGADDDEDAALADARAIADMKPFAVIDGPLRQAAAFSSELAAHGILCLGYCAVTLPEEVILDNLPYIWPAGPTANQAAALAAELIGGLAGPGPAELAGDPDLQSQDRRYAIVHYNTDNNEHTPVFEAMRDELEAHDIELAVDVEYQLDFVRLQETARTIVTRLKESDVTTVIFYGDFITPSNLTKEATAQDYRPEWILGPNLLADTARFARSFDQEQWGNGFGIAISPATGSPRTIDAYHVYEWAYGTAPPSPNFQRIEVGVRMFFTGIHLAGPSLTPDSFRDGLFRYVPSGGGPTTPRVSRGSDGVWDGIDYGGFDDAGILWWDPDVPATDVDGNPVVGNYRHANGGRRYEPGSFPASPDEAGLFDEDSSLTSFDELPAEDRPPDYPPPDR